MRFFALGRYVLRLGVMQTCTTWTCDMLQNLECAFFKSPTIDLTSIHSTQLLYLWISDVASDKDTKNNGRFSWYDTAVSCLL